MTASSRRERIEAMLVDDPHDVFLRYSLAMEMEKAGQHEQSLAKLGELMKDEPPYGPAFFMSAQQLAKLGRVSEACTHLQDGIEQANQRGDAHAAAEMTEMLEGLDDREE